MLEILGIKSAWQLIKIAVPVILILAALSYVWYLRSDNATLSAQKLQLTSQLLQAVDANRSNLETISTLQKDAKEKDLLTNEQQAKDIKNDKANDEAKKELRNDPTATEHVSPYIGNVFDRLRSIQQSEGIGPN